MAYLTRDDGERFVIPSYRDVLSAKKTSLLRKEVLLLSANYGEYITLQRKNAEQYEVAFSSDFGYLLGETIWSFFKRPQDLVYCEAIANTSEAILVIVKSGGVYLDGIFPVDVIMDELVIFRTQQSYFEIYIYGDVPISKTPEEDKFSFDSSSVKSFTVLQDPVFPTLPVTKTFQLQLVDKVLKAKGIGVFPVKRVITILAVIGFLMIAWMFLSIHKKELPQVIIRATDPYQLYFDTLQSPDPYKVVHWVTVQTYLLSTIPGWVVNTIDYSAQKQQLTASVKSQGATTHLLLDWAKRNNAQVIIASDGFHLTMTINIYNRPYPTTISYLNSVLPAFIDSIAAVLPGNNLELAAEVDKGKYAERQITIKFSGNTLGTLELIGQQFKNLPLVLDSVSIKIDETKYLTGTMVLRALGN